LQQLVAPLALAPDARFPRMRHNLIEGRIGDEEAFNQARIVRIRAGDFGRNRGTVGLRVTAIERQSVIELVGGAGGRIEPPVLVGPVEFRRGPTQILDIDRGLILAPAGRNREPIRDVEGVGEVDADIFVIGAETFRLHLCRRRKNDPRSFHHEARLAARRMGARSRGSIV
jgi:hypothetical protein